ncbi:MAG: type VI secretion system baseplate subunit TssE [Planctomycetaceae bacterium]|jgi:type VI secretion system protein ImpF|nr:type VI secretion system baseplate subunit TssE [Planctomycetaceae bacterium]
MSRIRRDQLLLPSILDRLIDEDPGSQVETPRTRNQLLRDLKNSVRRDLENLLNTRRSMFPIPDEREWLRQSVIGYGIPDFGMIPGGSDERREELRQDVEDTIRRFETRLKSLTVDLVFDPNDVARRIIRFRIDGMLHAEPAPEPVKFDSLLSVSRHEFQVKTLM